MWLRVRLGRVSTPSSILPMQWHISSTRNTNSAARLDYAVIVTISDVEGWQDEPLPDGAVVFAIRKNDIQIPLRR